MNIYYTGIGSRNTPDDVLTLFTNIGKWLGENNFILRSGAADGADSAFEAGCDMAAGKKEIFLPWKNFNHSSSTFVVKPNDKLASITAANHHPSWENLSDGARKLQTRNVYQVLGYDLQTPTSLVICYTPNGSASGGTGQAIRIAKYYDIPVLDYGTYKNQKDFIHDIWLILNEAKKNSALT